MATRIIKSSGCVYADLGIKKPSNPHHGSTLDSFLAEEAAANPKARRSKPPAKGAEKKVRNRNA